MVYNKIVEDFSTFLLILLGQKQSRGPETYPLVYWSDLMSDLRLIEELVPEINGMLELRYIILKFIEYNQPVGRRKLSKGLNLKERETRDEIDVLRDLNLLEVSNMGMNITSEGKNILYKVDHIYSDLRGIPRLEKKLKAKLNIKNAVVVPGDLSSNDIVIKEMGRKTFKLLSKHLEDSDIIGITGGSTMAQVSKEAYKNKGQKDVVVIPARGGLGKDLNTQSNSIAAKLANGLGGSYRLLYMPDNLEKEALEYILKNKEINESLNLIENMNKLVFGIGRADTMAKRRNLTKDQIEFLLNKGSVAEAFGHYFNINGKEIWEYKTIGLSLKKFKSLDNLIGVAGGEEKAEAILAISSLNENITLVTDESAAKKILKIGRNL